MLVGAFRQLWRWTKRKVANPGIILLYHSIAVRHSDPWSLSISADHFAEHLSVLRKVGQPISLQRYLELSRWGRVPSRPIIVTFDDGYANNLFEAKPLLSHHDVPATVFVMAGAVNQSGEFWWDELDRLLLDSPVLPDELIMCVGRTEHRWKLGKSGHDEGKTSQQDRRWRAWDTHAIDPRQALYRALYDLLSPLANSEREEALEYLVAWAGANRLGRPSYRTLSGEQLVRLTEGPLIEVGAHSVTHPSLATLSPIEQQQEIRNSKAILEGILNAPVRSFAYPFGRRQDYSRVTAALVREAGFTCACTSGARYVGRLTDRFELPRYTVPSVDGEQFSRWLTEISCA